ncbi:hypothetical protein AB0O91_30425 [Kitasatospora sp. NPDC089797]|uniref:helix-turn-helix transcriptional regulator n=1 Tax=Kitasatospora sp. NPDC089797 TaxID=3155298 RepID=UPI00341237A1
MAHPLTSLRAAMGLSQPEYARVVARTHDQLGFGRMAARREKISRWESGRIVPEFTAQLAIAHLHGVPLRDVRRLGWPWWTHLATQDTALLEQPFTSQAAVTVLTSTTLPADPTPAPVQVPLVRGAALRGQLDSALERLSRPLSGRTADDLGGLSGQVVGIERRTRVLETHNAVTLPASILYAAAHAEHRLIVALLTRAGHHGPAVPRLFSLAARTALLCGRFSQAVGEPARAERHGLAALRAATAAGNRELAARAMAQLARYQVLAGGADDALTLIHAARKADPSSSVATRVALHRFASSALAILGDARAAEAAFDRAEQHVTDAPDDESLGLCIRCCLSATRGAMLWHLDQPRRAAEYFRPLTDALVLTYDTAHQPFTALWPQYAVDIHLALRELDIAAALVHHTIDLTGALPPGLARDYRDKLSSHCHEPAIRSTLDRLNDTVSSNPTEGPHSNDSTSR